MRLIEGITSASRDIRRPPNDVGQHLGPARRTRDDQSGEVPELRWAAGLVELPERPLRQLVETIFLPPDLQSPRLFAFGRGETKLGERNPHLCGPTERVDVGFDFPYRVPRWIAAAAEPIGIVDHARGIDLKKQSPDVIMVGIEDHFEVIGIHVGVAPHETRPDAAGAGVIVHAGADV